jgi:hypothetical protein
VNLELSSRSVRKFGHGPFAGKPSLPAMASALSLREAGGEGTRPRRADSQEVPSSARHPLRLRTCRAHPHRSSDTRGRKRLEKVAVGSKLGSRQRNRGFTGGTRVSAPRTGPRVQVVRTINLSVFWCDPSRTRRNEPWQVNPPFLQGRSSLCTRRGGAPRPHGGDGKRGGRALRPTEVGDWLASITGAGVRRSSRGGRVVRGVGARTFPWARRSFLICWRRLAPSISSG